MIPAALPAPVDLDDLLEPFARRGIDLGLTRLQAALADGGHPERRFAAVQVAGTNGKGSICTMLEAILSAAGLRVGVYRSPHLLSWCERIQLAERWITPGELRRLLGRWQPIGRRHDLTPFELLTAAAFEAFADADLDLVVLEVGLGGRLDATSAHPDRRVVGFASLGLDHREHLGATLAAIAAEKAAVISPGSLAISAAQPAEAAAVLQAEAQRCGVELRWVQPLPAASAGGPALGLSGAFQRGNAAVAVGMADALRQRGWSIPEAAVRRGLAEARWPGRLEQRRWQGRLLLLDGAHNPPAAEALRQELNRRDGASPRRWLLGIQRHKDAQLMLPALLAAGDRALITAIPGHRSWSVAELAAACPELAPQLEAVDALQAGLAAITQPLATAQPSPSAQLSPLAQHSPAGPGSDPPLPVVAGSLHLLGAVLPLLDPVQDPDPPFS